MNKTGRHILLLGVLIVLLFVANLLVGSVSIPADEVFRILLGEDTGRASWRYIVWEARLPQALTAMLAGSALAAWGRAERCGRANAGGACNAKGGRRATLWGRAMQKENGVQCSGGVQCKMGAACGALRVCNARGGSVQCSPGACNAKWEQRAKLGGRAV